jgi:hypothetical protein
MDTRVMEHVIENWIDEAEYRVWFLYEATRQDCEKPAV